MVKREEIHAMQEAWRAYLDLALGFTQSSRKQATKVARKLIGKGGATADQLQTMAEELVKTSMANRESLTRLVRTELDRALARVGLATAEEVADLTGRVRDLEQRLRAAEANAATAATTATAASARVETAAPAPKPGAGVPSAATAKAAPPAAKKAAAVQPAKVAAKKAAARKAVTAKPIARKTAAKKAPGTPPGGPEL
jgi:polyhydroxyalkanoate synthesis regulator phasin